MLAADPTAMASSPFSLNISTTMAAISRSSSTSRIRGYCLCRSEMLHFHKTNALQKGANGGNAVFCLIVAKTGRRVTGEDILKC